MMVVVEVVPLSTVCSIMIVVVVLFVLTFEEIDFMATKIGSSKTSTYLHLYDLSILTSRGQNENPNGR